MKRLFVLAAISILLCSCVETKDSSGPLPTDYKCNSEQLKLVKIEVDICNETNYYSSYCFAQAKATICDPIEAAIIQD